MSNLATPNGWTTAGTAEAVSLPRRHLLAIAILMCVPLPVLSLAATVVPLPQMLERAAATFATIATPALRGDASVIRERTVVVGQIEIQYQPLEHPPTTTKASPREADGQPVRAATAQSATGPGKTSADTTRSGAAPIDPAGDADDGPVDTGTTGQGDGTTGQGEVDTPSTDPGAGTPAPAPKPEPPTSADPVPNQGGATGNSPGTGGTGGSKGTGGSGGAGGSGGTKDPGGGSPSPPSGGGATQDPGGGTTSPPAGSPSGGGSGSPPESPSDGGDGPKGGGGGRP